jgi:hypothetical protein
MHNKLLVDLMCDRQENPQITETYIIFDTTNR